MRPPELIHYEAMAKRNRHRHYFWLLRKFFPFLVFGGLAIVPYLFPEALSSLMSSDAEQDRSADAYYPNCAAARAAAVAPIHYGEPGYREGLDGDNDGIACEPYQPRQ